MKLNKQNNFQSFWLGDSLENKSLIKNDTDTKPKVDHIKLAGYQRAISNFVNIVTSKSIPVQFSQRGDSYTDGKVVTISSNLMTNYSIVQLVQHFTKVHTFYYQILIS